MTSNGNRSNPNSVRVDGKPDDPHAKDQNRSDITDRTQADSKSPGSRSPSMSHGSQQESRDHNKHNNAGQSGHKPQTHSPAQEKR